MTGMRALAAALSFIATTGWSDPGMELGMTPATERDWRYLADTVMGGVSQGQAQMGTENGQGFVRLTGDVSVENNGGFIQVRTETGPLDPTANGIALRVRSNGERYFIHLRTRATRLPWQYYQAGFDTGPDWQVIELPWSAFEPSARLLPSEVSPGSVRSIGLVAFGRDHRADVSLAEIGAF